VKYLKDVATLKQDPGKCTGCGMCLLVCPHRVFEPYEGKVRIADLDRCMECGACMKNCPFGAIEVQEGVGCAAAILIGMLTGSEPSCV
jgi:NAD-dependent dihydropyrimidine dehydrogenase PreA subunit